MFPLNSPFNYHFLLSKFKCLKTVTISVCSLVIALVCSSKTLSNSLFFSFMSFLISSVLRTHWFTFSIKTPSCFALVICADTKVDTPTTQPIIPTTVVIIETTFIYAYSTPSYKILSLCLFLLNILYTTKKTLSSMNFYFFTRISAMMKNTRYLKTFLVTNTDLTNSISYIYTSSNVVEIHVYRCGRLIYIFFTLTNTPTSSGFDVLYINGYNLPFNSLVGVGWGDHQSNSDFSNHKPCYVKANNSGSNIRVSINTTVAMVGSISAFGIIPIT